MRETTSHSEGKPDPKAGSPSAQAASQRRVAQRFDITDKQRLVLISGGRTYDCTIKNLSRGGLLLSLDGPAPLTGELVLEHCTAGFFPATRVWAKGNEIAVAFKNESGDLAHTLRCIRLLMSGGEADES